MGSVSRLRSRDSKDNRLQDIKNALPTLLDTHESIVKVEQSLHTSLSALQQIPDDDNCLELLKSGVIYLISEIMSLLCRSMPVIHTNSVLDLLLETISAASTHGSKSTDFVMSFMTHPYLDIIESKKFPFFSRLEVLKSLNTLFESTSLDAVDKFLKTEKSIPRLGSLLQLVQEIGDYEFQVSVFEFLFRAIHRRSRQMFAHRFIKDIEQRQAYLRIRESCFEIDCRKFLNQLNSKPDRLVISLPCKEIRLASLQLQKPNDEGYTDFWLDCNLGSKRLVIFCENSQLSTQKSCGDELWDAVAVSQLDVHKFTCWEEKGVKYATVMLKRHAACVRNMSPMCEDPVLYIAVDRQYDLPDALVRTFCPKKVSDSASTVAILQGPSQESIDNATQDVNPDVDRNTETVRQSHQQAQQRQNNWNQAERQEDTGFQQTKKNGDHDCQSNSDPNKLKASVPREAMSTPASILSSSSLLSKLNSAKDTVSEDAFVNDTHTKGTVRNKYINKDTVAGRVVAERTVAEKNNIHPTPASPDHEAPSSSPLPRLRQSLSAHTPQSNTTHSHAASPRSQGRNEKKRKNKKPVVTLQTMSKTQKQSSEFKMQDKEKASSPQEEVDIHSVNLTESVQDEDDQDSSGPGSRGRKLGSDCIPPTQSELLSEFSQNAGIDAPGLQEIVIPDSLPPRPQADTTHRVKNKCRWGEPEAADKENVEKDLLDKHSDSSWTRAYRTGKRNKSSSVTSVKKDNIQSFIEEGSEGHRNRNSKASFTPPAIQGQLSVLAKPLPASLDEFKHPKKSRGLTGLLRQHKQHEEDVQVELETNSSKKQQKPGKNACKRNRATCGQKTAVQAVDLPKSTQSDTLVRPSSEALEHSSVAVATDNLTSHLSSRNTKNKAVTGETPSDLKNKRRTDGNSVRDGKLQGPKTALKPGEQSKGLKTGKQSEETRPEKQSRGSRKQSKGLKSERQSKGQERQRQSVDFGSPVASISCQEKPTLAAGTSPAHSEMHAARHTSAGDSVGDVRGENVNNLNDLDNSGFTDDEFDNDDETELLQNDQAVSDAGSPAVGTRTDSAPDSKQRSSDEINSHLNTTNPHDKEKEMLVTNSDNGNTTDYWLEIETATPPRQEQWCNTYQTPSEPLDNNKSTCMPSGGNHTLYKTSDGRHANVSHRSPSLPCGSPALPSQTQQKKHGKMSTQKELGKQRAAGFYGNITDCKSGYMVNKSTSQKESKGKKVGSKKAKANDKMPDKQLIDKQAGENRAGMKLRQRAPKSYRECSEDEILGKSFEEMDTSGKKLRGPVQDTKLMFTRAEKEVCHNRSRLTKSTFQISVSNTTSYSHADPYDFDCESVNSYAQNPARENQKPASSKPNPSRHSKQTTRRELAKNTVFSWEQPDVEPQTSSKEGCPRQPSTMADNKKELLHSTADEMHVSHHNLSPDLSVSSASPTTHRQDQSASMMIFFSQRKRSAVVSSQCNSPDTGSYLDSSPTKQPVHKKKLGLKSPFWTTGSKQKSNRKCITPVNQRSRNTSEIDDTISVNHVLMCDRSELSWIARHKGKRNEAKKRAVRTYKRNTQTVATSPPHSMDSPEIASVEASPQHKTMTPMSKMKKIYSPLDLAITTSKTSLTVDRRGKAAQAHTNSKKGLVLQQTPDKNDTAHTERRLSSAGSHLPIPLLSPSDQGLRDSSPGLVTDAESEEMFPAGDNVRLSVMRQTATEKSPPSMQGTPLVPVARSARHRKKSAQIPCADLHGDFSPVEPGLVSGPSSIQRPSTEKLKRKYGFSEDPMSGGENNGHSTKRTCLIPRKLFSEYPNDSGDFFGHAKPRALTEDGSQDEDESKVGIPILETTPPFPEHIQASHRHSNLSRQKSKTTGKKSGETWGTTHQERKPELSHLSREITIEHEAWETLDDAGDGSDMRTVEGTERSGSTAEWRSTSDVEREEAGPVFEGGVSTLLRGFGADLQKQMRAKEHQIEQLTRDAFRLSHKHISQLWTADKQEWGEVLQEFRERMTAEMLALESDVTKLTELEKQAEMVYLQQMQAFQNYREKLEKSVETVKGQHEELRVKTQQTTANSRRAQKSMGAQLKKDMKTLEKRFLLDLQKQQLHNVRQSLQKLFH